MSTTNNELPSKLATELVAYINSILKPGIIGDMTFEFKLDSHRYKHNEKNPTLTGSIIFKFSAEVQETEVFIDG